MFEYFVGIIIWKVSSLFPKKVLDFVLNVFGANFRQDLEFGIILFHSAGGHLNLQLIEDKQQIIVVPGDSFASADGIFKRTIVIFTIFVFEIHYCGGHVGSVRHRPGKILELLGGSL